MSNEDKPTRFVNYTDTEGNAVVLMGYSPEDLVGLLPENYNGGYLKVVDKDGICKGWIGSNGHWSSN